MNYIFFLVNRESLENTFFSLITSSDCNAISNIRTQTHGTASMIYRFQVPNGDTD